MTVSIEATLNGTAKLPILISKCWNFTSFFNWEVGEVANIVKKIVRGDFKLSERKSDIQEELADVFIYLMKLSYQLDIDLEKAYMAKMGKIEKGFKL